MNIAYMIQSDDTIRYLPPLYTSSTPPSPNRCRHLHHQQQPADPAGHMQQEGGERVAGVGGHGSNSFNSAFFAFASARPQ
jgi:hypothetical protein